MSLDLKIDTENGVDNYYAIYDRNSSLKAYVAIDSTVLGPAIGGCRMLPYSSDEEAIKDVTRLAKSMTYKSALSGISYGGGKSVIIPPKGNFDRIGLFEAFGEFVNSLGGKYITAIDSGTTMADMDIVSRTTPYVTGYNNQLNCEFNPSYYTAKGVFEALLASVNHVHGSPDINGMKILVKGVGNVGRYMVDFAIERGAEVLISDVDLQKVAACSQETGVTPVIPAYVSHADIDILCPCDVEPLVTQKNIDNIKASIIVGATNNQLEQESLADQLRENGVLYCPDYLANAGGLVYVTKLYDGASVDDIEDHITRIGETATRVLQLADEQQSSTTEAANTCAQSFIDQHKFKESISA